MLAACALPAQAAAEDLVLDYEMRAMGFAVAYARVTATIEDTRYTIRVTGENTGLADLFGSLSLDATATGAFPGRGSTQDAQVRGDLIYFATPQNGACRAAGSIAGSQALPCPAMATKTTWPESCGTC